MALPSSDPIRSDHFPIHLNLNIRTKQECSKKPMIIRKLTGWMDEDFSACFESEDVELIWAIFKLITIWRSLYIE